MKKAGVLLSAKALVQTEVDTCPSKYQSGNFSGTNILSGQRRMPPMFPVDFLLGAESVLKIKAPEMGFQHTHSSISATLSPLPLPFPNLSCDCSGTWEQCVL